MKRCLFTFTTCFIFLLSLRLYGMKQCRNPNVINMLDYKGNTALYYAVKNKNDAMVQSFLEKNADLNATSSDQKKPLLIKAVSNSSLEIVKLLIENKANVNEQDSDGWTALHYAIEPDKGSRNYALDGIIDLLLQKNADISLCSKNEKFTTLHLTAIHNRVDLVKKVLSPSPLNNNTIEIISLNQNNTEDVIVDCI